MIAMFPAADTSAGNYRGALRDKPPGLPRSRVLWTCEHTHYESGDAVECAAHEMGRRWICEALGVPEGWQVHAVLNPGIGGHRGQLYAFAVTGPAHRAQDYVSPYRYYSEHAALVKGAAQAIASAEGI